MKKKLVEVAKEILNEIEELKKIEKMCADKQHGDVAHFRFQQHYGNIIKDYELVVIDRRHTSRLMDVINDIILELESKLEKL